MGLSVVGVSSIKMRTAPVELGIKSICNGHRINSNLLFPQLMGMGQDYGTKGHRIYTYIHYITLHMYIYINIIINMYIYIHM